jgi:hypothetical protein
MDKENSCLILIYRLFIKVLNFPKSVIVNDILQNNVRQICNKYGIYLNIFLVSNTKRDKNATNTINKEQLTMEE